MYLEVVDWASVSLISGSAPIFVEERSAEKRRARAGLPTTSAAAVIDRFGLDGLEGVPIMTGMLPLTLVHRSAPRGSLATRPSTNAGFPCSTTLWIKPTKEEECEDGTTPV